MLTKKDKKWLNHLSDQHKVKIVPFNPKVKEIFEKQKKEIQSILGENILVIHKGASNLGISGKGEIDVYVPVGSDEFSYFLEKLIQEYGKPGSLYASERARFNRKLENTDIEIFLINKDSSDWTRAIVFEEYLKIHPKELKAYEKLKEEANGLSMREYYRRKIEFINEIIAEASKK